jgi:predicted Rossmann fold flavoprotein
MTRERYSVAIVGGGPSGLMAAITAARAGVSVCLLERQDRVGRKLLATGNGRCNLSHATVAETNYHGGNPDFVTAALRQFGVQDTLALFDNLGILTTVEDDGEIYPLCGQASAVLDVLRYECERLGVKTIVGADVSRIVAGAQTFTVIHTGDQTESLAVVLAAGGKAMPQLGGGESGIRLATSLGHRLVPVYAGLVPLKTDCPYNRQLKGTKVDATVTLDVGGGSTWSQQGEVLFTEYGVSGPPLIQLSLPATRALQDGRNVRLVLDLFAEWDQQKVTEHLQSRFEKAGDATLEHALIGFCNKRLILPLLATAGLSKGASAASSIALAPPLAALCKAWTMTVTGALSYNEAHVMCGGIDCADVDPESLQSRKVEALYLTGELLDVTGDCGGYNLQWAWSSGYVAGAHAAQSASKRGER